jgi:ABC-type nickel/cobalt efflux system permease component RcnA
LGTVILLFKGPVMDRYESAAPVLEFGVGAMLVLLGAQVLWNLRRRRLHVHEHVESDGSHVHIHATHSSGEGPNAGQSHGFFHLGKPFFRVKSFTVGVVHGLAGSAAVMLILLPTLSSAWVGAGYLVLFGVGTILSMAAITLALGVPFAATGGSQRLNRVVATTAGVASAVIGVALMADTMFGTSLLPI